MPKISEIPKSVQEFPKVPKNNQECPSLAWVLPFIGSDLFILTSMVMSSITHGSHTYVCFYSNEAVKISDWTFKHIVFLIKVNVKSTICEVHSMLFIWVHAKFTFRKPQVLCPDSQNQCPDG